MENILNTLTEWWNTGVAFANTTGLLNTLYVIAFTYLTYRYRKKNQTITIDVSQSSKEVGKLQEEVAELRKQEETLTERIAILTELLFVFANSTKINDSTKTHMAELYAKAKDGNVIEKVKEKVVKVQEKVPEVIEEIKDVVDDVVEPGKDIYQKLKESIRN